MKGFILVIAVALLISGCLNSSTGDTDSNSQIPQTPSPQNRALVITGVVSEAFETSAEVTWTTNTESASSVRYGTESGKYPFSTGSRDYVIPHRIELSDLEPGSTYYYRVSSVTPDGMASQSREYNLTTVYIPPPLISGISVSPKSTSTLIEWTTDVPADSMVSYGTSSGLYTGSVKNEDFTSAHEIVIQNITPGNLYYYMVSNTNEKGVSSGSDEHTFETPPAQSGELIRIGNLLLKVEGLQEHIQSIGGVNKSYSKAEIEIENSGEEVIPVAVASTAVLNERGDQFNGVTLSESDEFTSTDLFPKGRLHKALYYERVEEGPGTLHLSLKTSLLDVFTLKVYVESHPTNITQKEEPIESDTPEETKKSIEINLDDFDSSFEIRSGIGRAAKSILYARVDVTLKNVGDIPVKIQLDPDPGLITDAGGQHLFTRTNHKDELLLGTLHPGGSISGAIFFYPEVHRQTNSLTLILYINKVNYEFVFNPGGGF